MGDKVAKMLGKAFAASGMVVMFSGAVCFFCFVLGLIVGGSGGERLALWADQIMNASMRLALVTTVLGLLQMYAAREQALTMNDSD